MKPISRWTLPPVPTRLTVKVVALLLALAGGLLILAWKSTAFLIMTALLAVAACIEMILHRRKLRRICAERINESICSFARSFNLHDIDPRIIRAVYEELIPYSSFNKGHVPIRPSDLFETFGIDGEELDDLASDVAHRSGRSMETPETNPYFGKVRTINDLVLFMVNQPLAK